MRGDDSNERSRMRPVLTRGMASEVPGTRWTLLVVRDPLGGSSRVNEPRRGVPRMSPALLTKRPGELEKLGVVERRGHGERGAARHDSVSVSGSHPGPAEITAGCRQEEKGTEGLTSNPSVPFFPHRSR